nr:hypothetical protein Iba_chr03aCG21350 [Ipomoea batatas]
MIGKPRKLPESKDCSGGKVNSADSFGSIKAHQESWRNMAEATLHHLVHLDPRNDGNIDRLTESSVFSKPLKRQQGRYRQFRDHPFGVSSTHLTFHPVQAASRVFGTSSPSSETVRSERTLRKDQGDQISLAVDYKGNTYFGFPIRLPRKSKPTSPPWMNHIDPG